MTCLLKVTQLMKAYLRVESMVSTSIPVSSAALLLLGRHCGGMFPALPEWF